MTAALYVIHHSPWSERARWALDHHGVAFEEREHVPLVGELLLRARAGRWTGKASVPLFVDPAAKATVQGSTAIAEYADTLGSGAAKLFPPGSTDAMRTLDAAIEDALDAARARFVRGLASDRAARLASLPRWMRLPLVGSPSARLGAWFIASKYDSSFEGMDDRIRAGLRAVREALGSRDYVRGVFSYADILAASAVQAIVPLPEHFLDVPAPTRRLWLHEELAREFADLVAWRDAIYPKHRAKHSQIA